MSVCAILATWKLTKKQVTPTQKFILLSYADRAGESFECWPSNSRLEKDTGYDRHTICENKQQLLEKGLISYTGEKRGRTKSIDVIRLNYVMPREGHDFEVFDLSSVEMPTARNLSSVEMPTAKQCGNAHTEPNILEPKNKILQVSEKHPLPVSKPAALQLPKAEKEYLLKEKDIPIEPYIDIWNLFCKTSKGIPMGKAKRQRDAIKRNLQIIAENWEQRLTPDNFKTFLDHAWDANFYLLTKYPKQLDVILRWNHFEEAYYQTKQAK
jgi:hypothetical protein